MTPKEKARELFYLFNEITSNEFKSDNFKSATAAKLCAMIAVGGIIQEVNQNFTSDRYAYWQQVRNEIEKL